MGKPVILIVDDEKVVAGVIAECLRKHDLNADIVNSGKEALEYADKHNPDLIVLDLFMPEMDGYEVLEKLKSQDATKYIPVVMLTSKISQEHKIKALDMGAEDYINKPYDAEEVVARVKAVLRRAGSCSSERKIRDILVTGGAGFIGSYLTEALIEKGYVVHILDDFSTGRMENLAKVKDSDQLRVVTGSVTDEVLLDKTIEQCDYVYHLAATVGVKNVVDGPLDTIMYDTFGTEKVLKYAAAKGIKVLLTSTSEVYGKTEKVPFKENADIVLGPPDVSRWSYACSKLLDEFLAMAYYKERALQVAVVRFFNVVGPRQLGRYGMVIPRFFKSALAGEPLHVYGDGEQSRCFTYVEDAIEILLRISESQEAYGEVTNLGNNAEISINDLASKIKKLTGSSSEIVRESYETYYGDNFQDIRRRLPDLTKMEKISGILPQTNIEEILEKLNKYYKGNPEELEKV